MSLILDSSIALAWTYADEATHPVLQLFDAVKKNGAWVPGLWRWEVANVLLLNANRGRHSREFSIAALSALAVAPIRVDADAELIAWSDTFALAERRHLTVYDAAYLELSLRRRLPLATLDRQLRAAARDENVELLGM